MSRAIAEELTAALVQTAESVEPGSGAGVADGVEVFASDVERFWNHPQKGSKNPESPFELAVLVGLPKGTPSLEKFRIGLIATTEKEVVLTKQARLGIHLTLIVPKSELSSVAADLVFSVDGRSLELPGFFLGGFGKRETGWLMPIGDHVTSTELGPLRDTIVLSIAGRPDRSTQ